MADIAILVAEEYERRTRRSCSQKRINVESDGDDQGTSLMGSGIAVLGQKLGDGWSWMKKLEEEKKLHLVKVLEPKSPFGVLAINGVFSA